MSQCTTQHTTEDFGRTSVEIVKSFDVARGRSPSDRDPDLACAALELVTAVSESLSLSAAGTILVNRLKVFLHADGVALGIVRPGRRRCHLVSIAGTTGVNRGSELSVAMEQALHNATLDTAGSGARHATEGQIVLQDVLPGCATATARLSTRAGATTGAMAVWGQAAQFDPAHAENMLCVLSEPLAASLKLLQQAEAGPIRRCVRHTLCTRRSIVWSALALIGLSVLVLLPYRIRCACAVEPLKRRFIAAPFAGVFEKSLVRPGDVVAKEDVLGRMDGHALRLELAAVTADQQQARKSHDVNLAAGKVAAAQIDKLELNRLEQQRTLLEHRLSNIDIRSPVAGYVISGDMERSEGAPLEIGDVLYEVAPLDQMTVEVAVDDREIAGIAAGQRVDIRFDAYPGKSFAGRISRIHPRSEVRESQNVFIAEISLDNTGVTLRPGMKGMAQIRAAEESLAAGVVRRTWHSLTALVGF